MMMTNSTGVHVKPVKRGGAPTGTRNVVLITALSLWCLSGCTASDVGYVKTTPLDEAIALTEKADQKTYVIAAGDDITVRFYYSPQLDEDLRVRPDGKISLSLVGDLDAA